MKDWAVTIGLACLVGLACFFWGRSTIHQVDRIKTDTLTVFLPAVQVDVQGHPTDTVFVPTLPQDAPKPPEPTVDTPFELGSVQADTLIVARNDSVKVTFRLGTTYYLATMMFRHDISQVAVSYPQSIVYVPAEARSPYWWERPLEVGLALSTGYLFAKEKYAPAAVTGVLLAIKLSVNF